MIDSILEVDLPKGETEESFRAKYQQWLTLRNINPEGYPPPLAIYDLFYSLSPDFTVLPTPLPQLIATLSKDYEKAVEARIQQECTSAGFDSIFTACDYAAVDNPLQAVSITFVKWRAAVWLYCRDQLQQIEAGEIPIPPLEDYIASLPVRETPS